MREHPIELFNRRSSTREFLLNKTELKVKDDPGERMAHSTLNDLLKQFPDMLYGTNFIDTAMKALKSSTQFSAMVMRIDGESVSGEGFNTPLIIDVLKTLDFFCRDKKAIWGMMEEDVPGAFFPGIHENVCLSLSKTLQRNLFTVRSETVTIGVAAYPTLDYEKHQILDNAGKALDHAMFFGPSSAVAFDAISLNISGDNRYQRGDINGAIEEYRKALKIDPINVNVYNSLGVCYGVLKRYKKALAFFRRAVELDHQEVMAIYNIGLVHMLRDDRKKALENFNNAYLLAPEVFEIAFHIGKCHLDSKEYNKATEFLEKAVEIQPDSALALSCLGQCYTALEITDKAIKAFQNAIKKNPKDAEALSGLGYLFEVQNENPEIATMFCQESVMISPDNGLFQHRLGRLYLKQDRLDDATKAFLIASELGYDSTPFIQEIEHRQTKPSSP